MVYASSMQCLVLKAFLLAGQWHPATASEDYSAVITIANLENGGSGRIVIDVHPEWAPRAAERFSKLVRENYFDGSRFFKVIAGFTAHFGLPADPALLANWQEVDVPPDPRIEMNSRGHISFATEDGRPTEIVINAKDNDHLDNKGYAPFAEIKEGMFIIDRLMNRYGSKPEPHRIEKEGNNYLMKEFPNLSYIETVQLVPRNPHEGYSVGSDMSFDHHQALPLLLALFASAAVGAFWFLSVLRNRVANTNIKI
jgi:cyclophilin family peptidyl-prolyl cis-trans isomerase